MKTITDDQMLARAKSLVPRGWLPDTSPLADGVLAAFASVASHAYGLLVYVKAQGRVLSASDGFLDLIAYDLFGLRFKRRKGQNDLSYTQAIIGEVLRERVTRAGVTRAVADLSGHPARMFEPWNTGDTGGFDHPSLAFDFCGRWGSLDMPFEFFVATLPPLGAGLPNVGGFDVALGALDIAPDAFGDPSLAAGAVTDQDIYDAVVGAKAAGTKPWVAIGLPVEAHLDDDFVLDQSELV